MGSPLELGKSPTDYLIGRVIKGDLSQEEQREVVGEIEQRWRKEGERDPDELDTVRYNRMSPPGSQSSISGKK